MEEQSKPYITFLMCSRKKENPDSELEKFLYSFAKHIGDQETDKVEILIKFDEDDTDTQNLILDRNAPLRKSGSEERLCQTNLLKTFPYIIKHFVYKRGMGRRSLQNDYMFLFSQRSPSSKFIAFVTDDSIMLREGMIQELERIKNKDWVFMGDKRPMLEKYQDYRNNQDWRNDVSMFPVISTKIVECVQNFGWQVNVDNWITLLAVILYHKYGLDLWEGSYTQYVGRAGGDSRETQYSYRYNPMEINNKFPCSIPYYFDLVEQQAKNIYLNYQSHELNRLANIIQREFKMVGK